MNAYLIDIDKYLDNWFELSDSDWISVSISQENIYNLKDFQIMFNNGELGNMVVKFFEIGRGR